MCTSIVEVVAATGAAKDGDSWFELDRAVVAYDHPRHAFFNDGIAIDFFGQDRRAAVELTLESAKALRDALAHAIEDAEIEEGLVEVARPKAA